MRALYQWDPSERFSKENSFGELVIIQIPIHKAFDLVKLCIIVIILLTSYILFQFMLTATADFVLIL